MERDKRLMYTRNDSLLTRLMLKTGLATGRGGDSSLPSSLPRPSPSGYGRFTQNNFDEVMVKEVFGLS